MSGMSGFRSCSECNENLEDETFFYMGYWRAGQGDVDYEEVFCSYYCLQEWMTGREEAN